MHGSSSLPSSPPSPPRRCGVGVGLDHLPSTLVAKLSTLINLNPNPISNKPSIRLGDPLAPRF
jgi:hypothetical protein